MATSIDAAPELARENLRGYALNIIAAGVIVAILYWARIVFITVSLAVITALILEPFVSLLVKIRFPRALASLVVCLVALLALYLTGLAAYRQLSSIASDVPAFKENLANFIDNVAARVQSIEDASTQILVRRPPPPVVPPASSTKKTRKSTPR